MIKEHVPTKAEIRESLIRQLNEGRRWHRSTEEMDALLEQLYDLDTTTAFLEQVLG